MPDDISCKGEPFGEFTNNTRWGTKVSQCDGTYQYLLGCGVNGYVNGYDGSYPGLLRPDSNTIIPDSDYSYSQYCTAVHGKEESEGTRTIGDKQCCKSPSYNFNCVIRYSASSLDAGSSSLEAQVSCDTGYVMTGCSGWGSYNRLRAYWISAGDTTIDKCWARSQRFWNDADSYSIYAIATCCKLEFKSPSDQPTASPTNEPTLEPTASPSISPSSAPVHPTVSPTVEPSPGPTYSPSLQVSSHSVCVRSKMFFRNSNILNLFVHT